MFFNRKKNAFSLVELMMILLVAALITAALFPVVTKKHFRLPTLVNHGAYLCYYKDGKLHEAKWAGKMKTKELFNRETDNCVFVPPKKAGYFEISAIGGGGGGGDAGYTGGDWISSIETTEMTPFQRTESELKAHGISTEEFWKYAGWIMGYAKSIGSGNGGDIGYVYRTSEDMSECTDYEQVEVKEYAKENVCKVKYADGKCQKYKCVTEDDCVTEDVDSTCTRIIEPVCKEWNKPVKTTVTVCTKCVKTNCKMVTIKDAWIETNRMCCMANIRTNECIGAPYKCKNGSSGTIDQSSGLREVETTAQTINHPAETEEHCDFIDQTKEETTQTCKVWDPEDKKTRTEEYACKKSQTTCTPVKKEVEIGKPETMDESKCVADDNVYTGSHYEKGKCLNTKEWTEYTYHHTMNEGGSGGSGANCYGGKRAGDLNLNHTQDTNVNRSDVRNGDNVDSYQDSPHYFYLKSLLAGFGTASCYPRKLGVQNCNGSPSYSYYQITGGSTKHGIKTTLVKAYSASVGGNGASRTVVPGDSKDPNWDGAPDTENAAEDGYCNAGSYSTEAYSSPSPKCTGSGYYGYCLIHHYAPNTAEADGMYKYEFGHDMNYLGYGEPGSPGEFKTTIVRTLKGVDTTIKVGRGGSAAALNSGARGTAGSMSSFGDILSAAGGAGGEGHVTTTMDDLPVYDAKLYEKESKCFYYSQAFAKKSDGTYLKEDNDRVISTKTLTYGDIRKQIEEEPNYCKDLINNQGNYKYYRISTNNTSAQNYPTPIGIFSSFLNLAFKNLTGAEDSPLERFTKSGRGGKAGAVEHRCWAGRGEVFFENIVMKSSIFPDLKTANEIKNNPAYAWPAGWEPKYVPSNCRIDYSNIPAGPGADGAVLIKW